MIKMEAGFGTDPGFIFAIGRRQGCGLPFFQVTFWP